MEEKEILPAENQNIDEPVFEEKKEEGAEETKSKLPLRIILPLLFFLLLIFAFTFIIASKKEKTKQGNGGNVKVEPSPAAIEITTENISTFSDDLREKLVEIKTDLDNLDLENPLLQPPVLDLEIKMK